MVIGVHLHLFVEPITEYKIMCHCYPMRLHGMICAWKTQSVKMACVHQI